MQLPTDDTHKHWWRTVREMYVIKPLIEGMLKKITSMIMWYSIIDNMKLSSSGRVTMFGFTKRPLTRYLSGFSDAQVQINKV